MKRKWDKKIWPSPTGIWTPDFWANSCPKFEFWGRLVLSSSCFLDILDFKQTFCNYIITTLNPFFHVPVPTPCANKVHMQPKENQVFFAFNISSVIDVWTRKINKYVFLFIFIKIKFIYFYWQSNLYMFG